MLQGTLEGRVVLVTGGSRGIGKAVSLACAGAGARIVLNYVKQSSAADETIREIIEAGGQARAVQGDVAKPEDAERLVQDTINAFGRLDILVNNAGITRDNLVLRMSEADWDAVIDANLKGAFLCAKAAIRPMMKARWGRIINLTSVVGMHGNAGQANYAAAKAGMIGLTKAIAREIASRQVTVNAVAPGFIDVGMTEGLTTAQRDAALGQIPLGRFGRAEDVANLVVFLASEQAGYITGAVIPVDGGMGM